MIDSKSLLSDLQSQVILLEDDLRKRCDELPEVDAPLKAEYEAAKKRKRTAMTYSAWRDGELTQIAVAWVLACVFIRFLEDNELVDTPKLSGPGDRLQRARDEHELYFRNKPEDNTERGYLKQIFEEAGALPAMREFFDPKLNPLWKADPSGDACLGLWKFWQKVNTSSGGLIHDFTDPEWNTRFLGDLYQDLSVEARKRYALLQTPDFVEAFILDRTLTPAIDTFGYKEVRLIDPTCGSGHFLLGAFDRLFSIWQKECPGENPRVLVQHALDGVYGVDLNPYAVSIARFRLLLAGIQACGDTKKLKSSPDFQINLAVGDSLLHGARFRRFEGEFFTQQTFDTEEIFQDELKHHFEIEDEENLHRILGQQYHAVVGNPPYIQASDAAVNRLYRSRYSACAGKFALSVPFVERFFDLALSAVDEKEAHAGFTGQITANSFMKRKFGSVLIEEHIPKLDITHIIDTSWAYIPGMGTSTVILFGRKRPPSSPNVRILEGIKGETTLPPDPSKAKVWVDLLDQVDVSEGESNYFITSSPRRDVIEKHPWILSALARNLGESHPDKLEKGNAVGSIGVVTLADEAFVLGSTIQRKLGIHNENRRNIVEGDLVRDWLEPKGYSVIFPYDKELTPTIAPPVKNFLWDFRAILRNRIWFRKTQDERELNWWEFGFLSKEIALSNRLITFAFVSTHNHFSLIRGRRIFKQSAPVIILPEDATEEDYLELLGYLNSSVACFWMKQVFYPKGGDHVGQEGARVRKTLWDERYEIDGTKLKKFPLPNATSGYIAKELEDQAQEILKYSPYTLTYQNGDLSKAFLEGDKKEHYIRSRQISLQEELDWQCYRHYGLTEADDDLEWSEDRLDDLPPLSLGERTFEILMARQMAAGELETTWFERHKDAGSKPITELPSHWPDDYRALVERRLAFIENNKNINLIERPEYKRRWNTEPWAKRQKDALHKWLLARLEGYFFEGSRVCDLKDSFDPGTKGFIAATRPFLTSANQLADVVQSDAKFMEAAEIYEGSSGFSVPELVRNLIASESVPYLPSLRYSAGGLRKRSDWEETWDLQRREDEIEAALRKKHAKKTEAELKELIAKAQKKEVGDIPVPPKYKMGAKKADKDFLKDTYWKLRGKLDVPKERWISYPGAERNNDDSLVIAWAGWDHYQQAQALAEYFLDAKESQGWPKERLLPLLAGLADLIPWLKQWHNEVDPNYGMGLGDYFAGFQEEQCRALDLTVEDAEKVRIEVPA